jgi:ATP-dependent exoDNAse (exonuclease V) beta subunit
LANSLASLKIYRSSAGAGKTHTLVSEYINLALDNPEEFSQILAVTFTNQATQEMKQRILVYLHSLAQGTPSPVATALLRDKGWNMAFLQNRAQAVLSNILHQYARFSVSTIDSFFQKIIRGFAQELGLQSGFRVELDQQYVLNTIIDDLVVAAGQHQQLQQWLVAFAEDKLLSGKSWNFKRELADLGQELFSEPFGTHAAQLAQATSNQAALHQFLRALHQHITHFENKLQGFGQQALTIIEQSGLAVDDFAYGKAGVAGYLAGLATKRKWTPSQRALCVLERVEAWYSRASDKRDRIEEIVNSALQPCLKEVVHFYNTHHRVYHTALEVRHFIYAFGIVTQLLERLNDYRATHNVMLVSDASIFLRKIIAENETPFVYEKMGAFYKHFLIDEFQDISGFQWHNFKPLIENSLNEGHPSLVVGDVKQSIYRWRGGDWRLLLTQLEKDVAHTTTVTLDKNWRSKQHIIDFNNFFFSTVTTTLAQQLTEELAMLEDPTLQKDLMAQVQQLGNAYQEVHQQLPPQRVQPDKGYVNITFLEDTVADNEASQSWRERVKARLTLLIEQLQQDGIALKDIALLVRSNAEGRDIFRTLLAHQHSSQAQPGCRYDVISSESLYLGHNPWVNILINALKCLVQEKAPLAQAELFYLYRVYVLQAASTALHNCFQAEEGATSLPKEFVAQRRYLQQLPLYELIEALIALFQLHQATAVPFLQAFQDVVLAFEAKEVADVSLFLAWWEERGYRYTLPRAVGQEAMTLMTIHQAKGLQFKVVILPFCAWDLDHNIRRPPTLWSTTDVFPFASFPVLPVRYTPRLKDTIYARAYYEEHMQAYLDHLNLLYVAFTRPEDQLYVFAQRPAKIAIKTTSDLLYQTFSKTQETTTFPKPWDRCWDVTQGVLEMGTTKPLAVPETPKEASTNLQQYRTSNWLQKHLENKVHSFETLEQTAQASYGKLVHRLLAQLTSIDAWPMVLAAMQTSEDIGQEEVAQLKQQLTALSHHSQVKSWFSSDWEVKKEAAILTPSGKILRPDRVLLQPGKAVVIDFKTGQQNVRHAQQVQAYTALLRAMGYVQVEGYLLYIEAGEVVAC